MARPRIFISSTFYDLSAVRSQLDLFIRTHGFDPVLHERSGVPYGRTGILEDDCYAEVGNSDIVVAIIGGRFGTASQSGAGSISQQEIKAAIELRKQIYVFVKHDVLSEYATFTKNRDKDIDWASVDSVEVFNFLNDLHTLSIQNPIFSFQTGVDIIEHLRDQWAGLFSNLLKNEERKSQSIAVRELKDAVNSARSLVEILSDKANIGGQAVAEIVVLNHPLLRRLRDLLNVPYRFYASTKVDLDLWLSARSYIILKGHEYLDGNFVWERHLQGNISELKISECVFDQERILQFSDRDWKDEWVQLTTRKMKPKEPSSFPVDMDDDVPF